jgi:hypothetical protein
VGHDPVALGHRLEMVTDVTRLHFGDGSPRNPDSIGTDLVKSGGTH